LPKEHLYREGGKREPGEEEENLKKAVIRKAGPRWTSTPKVRNWLCGKKKVLKEKKWDPEKKGPARRLRIGKGKKKKRIGPSMGSHKKREATRIIKQ